MKINAFCVPKFPLTCNLSLIWWWERQYKYRIKFSIYNVLFSSSVMHAIYLCVYTAFYLFINFIKNFILEYSWLMTSWVVQMVKKLLVMQETWDWSLSQKDPLEEGMATSILVWRISWIEEPGRLQSMWLQRIRHNWVTNHFHFHSWLTVC